MYKFLCKDNKYTEYQYVETKTFQPIDTIQKSPIVMKLFVNDIFDYDTNTHKPRPGPLSLLATLSFFRVCSPVGDEKTPENIFLIVDIPENFLSLF